MKYLSLDLEKLRKSKTWLVAHKHPWMGLACLNLWMAAADRDGEGIPDDDDALARLAGISLEAFQTIKNSVLSAWSLKNGEWFHPEILAEIGRYKKKVSGGKKGAKNRWENKEVDGSPNSRPNDIPNSSPNGSPNANPPSHSQSHSQNTTPLPPSKPTAGAIAAVNKNDALFDRVCTLLKITPAKLRRNNAWINLPAVISGWVSAGCDPELDIWPTIERMGLAAIARGAIPQTPGYFNAEIIAHRDRRLLEKSTGSSMVTVEKCVDPHEWADRLSVWRNGKKWSSKWGPNPAQPGCLVPSFILDHPQGHIYPQFREPSEPAWQWGPGGTHNWPSFGE